MCCAKSKWCTAAVSVHGTKQDCGDNFLQIPYTIPVVSELERWIGGYVGIQVYLLVPRYLEVVHVQGKNSINDTSSMHMHKNSYMYTLCNKTSYNWTWKEQKMWWFVIWFSILHYGLYCFCCWWLYFHCINLYWLYRLWSGYNCCLLFVLYKIVLLLIWWWWLWMCFLPRGISIRLEVGSLLFCVSFFVCICQLLEWCLVCLSHSTPQCTNCFCDVSDFELWIFFL